MSDTPSQPAQEQPRKKISAEEFIKIWKGAYKGVEGYEEFYDSSKYSDEKKLFGSNSNKKSVPAIFENIIVSDYIHTYAPKSLGTHFLDLILINSRVDTFDLGFINCENIFIRDSSVIGNIMLWGKSVIGTLLFSKSCNVKDISIFQKSNINQIVVEHNTSTGYYRMLGESRVDNFIVRNNSVIGDIYVQGKSIMNQLQVSLNSSFSNLLVKDNSIFKILDVASKSKGSIINIGDSINSDRFIISNSEIQSLDINDSSINELTIKGESRIMIKGRSNVTVINNLNLKEIILHKESYFHISGVKVFNIDIDSLLNNGKIIFNSILPSNNSSVIRIHNSDLGNMQFIGCHLASFRIFEFKNSKMAGVFLADTPLPYRKNISTSIDADENEQRRLALSQFKKIYEGQGDTVRAADFRAQEMEVYRSQLKPFKQFGTWLILSFSHLTSNYGNSIWRPLYWLLNGHYLLFILALSINAFDFEIITNTKEITSYYYFLEQKIYAYFYLMSPLRKVYLFKYNWTILIDLMMRVWSSYMIYNFIRASRRFIK